MAVDIQGSVILMGSVEWEAGTTMDGSAILAMADGDDATLKPMAPVPYPPAPPGNPMFTKCTTGFSAGKIMMLVNPNTAGHTIAGKPMVCMGSMFLQMNDLPCTPMIGIGTGSALATLPVCKVSDKSTFMGIMHGAGAM